MVSRSLLSQLVAGRDDLTLIRSWGPVALEGRYCEAGNARDFVESSSPDDWRGRVQGWNGSVPPASLSESAQENHVQGVLRTARWGVCQRSRRSARTCRSVFITPIAMPKLTTGLDHCLEVLRMNLQCNADVGLFTLYMVEGDPLAWPQLNSKHVCRNFNKVRQWALDHSVGNMEAIV